MRRAYVAERDRAKSMALALTRRAMVTVPWVGWLKHSHGERGPA
jgi:hypothetical protein